MTDFKILSWGQFITGTFQKACWLWRSKVHGVSLAEHDVMGKLPITSWWWVWWTWETWGKKKEKKKHSRERQVQAGPLQPYQIKPQRWLPLRQKGGRQDDCSRGLEVGPRVRSAETLHSREAGAEPKGWVSFAKWRGKGIPGQDTVGTSEQTRLQWQTTCPCCLSTEKSA